VDTLVVFARLFVTNRSLCWFVRAQNDVFDDVLSLGIPFRYIDD
jgi:hypothetical protein